MRILLISASLVILAAMAPAQEPADGRWLNDETWQPRNQHATIDNTPGGGGGWPTITDWGEDIRLTYFDDPWAHNAEIAVYGDNVYVTWYKLYEEKIYFLRSTNGGWVWFDNVQISDDSTYNAVMPQISAYGNNAYVAYKAWRPYQGIYLKRSTDRGTTWRETQRLYYTARNHASMPVITSKGQHVFCIFAVITDLNPFISKLFLTRSANCGESWSDTIFVSELTYSGLGPDLSMNNSGLHLIRGKNLLSSSTTEILYNRSTDDGDNWLGPDTLSYNDSSGSFWPQIAAWGDSNVIFSWTDYKYSPYAFTGDAFICKSTDNGETWSQPVQMTDLHLVKATDISADADTVFLVYSDYRYGDREIVGNISYDGGITWEGEIRLTDAPGQSVEPSCELRDGVAHLTWCDGRLNPEHALYEVYYKRGDLRTGISDTFQNLPLSDWIVSNYPNPFNSSTTITLNQSEGGDVSIGIYDITGRLVRELETSNKEGGEIKAAWDATDNSGRSVSSGIYFARVESGDFSSTIKLVYLR